MAKKKVLIVDDSQVVREQVRVALERHGLEIVEASDGADGMEKIAADPEIALVLLDVNMPRMNGLEMLEKVKATDRSATLPIIMLTSEGQLSLIERAKKAGAKGWIVKPFKAEQLAATTRKILSL